MKDYKIYRTLRVDASQINFDSIGISWAASEYAADKFASQFGEDYILISAVVKESQINIAQTNAQWEDKQTAHEEEVVLNEFESIVIFCNGKQYNANTGTMNRGDYETRPNPVECLASDVTDYLEEA